MIKILVADTFGSKGLVHPDCFERFPKAKFIFKNLKGNWKPENPHPHGFQVASRLLLPLIDQDVEIHLVRFLDHRGLATKELFEYVDSVKPDIWQNSWGQDPQHGGTLFWKSWVAQEKKLRKKHGYFIVFAAGNIDTFGIGYFDVNYPQRLIKEAVVVGAADRKGVVTEWSSDGNVTCVALGHRVLVLNPFTNQWEGASGTSFSSPDVAGLLGRFRILSDMKTQAQFIEWLKQKATIPKGFPKKNLPHPKFGWGGVIDFHQKVTKKIEAYGVAGVPSTTPKDVAWVDFAHVPVDPAFDYRFNNEECDNGVHLRGRSVWNADGF